MQLKLKQSHDKRKYPYYVTTRNYKYYFSRKADAAKMFDRRVRVLRYAFAFCLENINKVTLKYSKSKCCDVQIQRDFHDAQMAILSMSQYSEVTDYENRVFTLVSCLCSVTQFLGMKNYHKKVVGLRVSVYDTPVSPYALSPYFVEVILR